MFQRESAIRQLWPIILIVVFAMVISACGGDDEPKASGSSSNESNSESSSNQGDSTSSDALVNSEFDSDSDFASVALPEMNELALPSLPDLSGSLVFTRGRSLYRGAFNGESAEIVVSDISAATVDVSPDGQYVAYTSPGIRRLKMLFQQLDTSEITELSPVSGNFRQVAGHITGWSPDEEWVIVNDVIGPRYFVVSIDGATSVELDNTVYPMWLEDNRVLLIEVDRTLLDAAQSFQPQLVVGASVFDPTTQETAELDLDMEAVAFPLDYNGISVTIQSEGLRLAPSSDVVGYSVVLPDEGSRLSVQLPEANRGFTPEQCNVWTIDKLTEDGTIETVYTADEVMWLTDLTVLSDESVLFLEWSSVDCTPDGMQLALKRLMLDGDVVQVVEGISRIEDGRNNLNLLVFNQAHRYTVSPDGQYVVWPGGDIDNRPAGLNLTDINTGETMTLLQANSGTDANAFMDNDMFRSVFWVEE